MGIWIGGSTRTLIGNEECGEGIRSPGMARGKGGGGEGTERKDIRKEL